MFSITKSGYNGGDATSHAIPLPASIGVGDTMLLFVGLDANPTVAIAADGIDWELMHNATPSNTGRFYKGMVTSAPSSGFITLNLGASEACAAAAYRLRSEDGDSNQLGITVLVEFANTSSSTTPTTGQVPIPWSLPSAVEKSLGTMTFSALTGTNTGTVAINSYPTGFDNETEFRTSGTGTAHVAIAVGVKTIETNNPATPTAWSLSASVTSVGFTVVVQEMGILSVTPNNVFVNTPGSTDIKIAGILESVNDVLFGTEASVDVELLDAQTLQVNVPVSEDAGAVDVIIDSDFPDMVAVDSFTYLEPAPIITELLPPGSAVDTQTPFTIKGVGFESGATVTIDGENCTDIVFVDSETITAVCPVSAIQKLGVLILTNPDLQTATASFYYMEQIPEPGQPGEVTAKFSVEPINFVQ